jgi:8-oxo-dGTP diphosphatase
VSPAGFVVVPASYVYLLRDGIGGPEVLLQLRQNTGYMDGHWAAAAAGHVERGETAYDTARREAVEELGVD